MGREGKKGEGRKGEGREGKGRTPPLQILDPPLKPIRIWGPDFQNILR